MSWLDYFCIFQRCRIYSAAKSTNVRSPEHHNEAIYEMVNIQDSDIFGDTQGTLYISHLHKVQ